MMIALNLKKARQVNLFFNFQIIPFFQNYGTSWTAGPEDYHYQFHLSEQSWNMAREHCLALASDLVVITSLEQIVCLSPMLTCKTRKDEEWSKAAIVANSETTKRYLGRCSKANMSNHLLALIYHFI